MTPKLIKTILLAIALGFFMLWILEIFRTDLSNSYWLLMLSLTFLLVHQYYRLRTTPSPPTVAKKPTKPTTPTKSKKK